MEEKKPSTIRLPADVRSFFWPTLKRLSKAVRGTKYGDVAGTALVMFMGLSENDQQSLVESFNLRPSSMNEAEAIDFGEGFVFALQDQQQSQEQSVSRKEAARP